MPETPITNEGLQAALTRAKTKLDRQKNAVRATETELALLEERLGVKKTQSRK